MNIHGASIDVSDGNEEHAVGNWAKMIPFRK